MKKLLRKITFLGKVTKFKTRVMDYNLVASSLEEFVLRQERFIDRLSWRSSLPPRFIRTLIHDSTLILTFSTLLGLDIAGLKGAVVGSTIGVIVVIGNTVFHLFFIRSHKGIDLEIIEV